MLSIHKVIDALSGNTRQLKPHPIPGWQGQAERTLKFLRMAECFDFGMLPLEQINDEGDFNLPKATDDEKSWWTLGLLPLPAQVCWFEFQYDTPNPARSALLITEEFEKGWMWQRLDIVDKTELYFEGVWVRLERATAFTPDGGWQMNFGGNHELLELMEKREGIKWCNSHWGMDGPLALYLNLMLNSKTTDKVREVAPHKLNKARVKRGDTPLLDHTVVTIIPQRFRERAEHVQGTGGPKRMHWRRSHVRHFDHRTPGSIWSATIEHQGRVGWWCVVIPRFIVGKDDSLGQLTHEYRVVLPEPEKTPCPR